MLIRDQLRQARSEVLPAALAAVSLLVLAPLLGCTVDVPKTDEASFACENDGHCADGYRCWRQGAFVGVCALVADCGRQACPDGLQCDPQARICRPNLGQPCTSHATCDASRPYCSDGICTDPCASNPCTFGLSCLFDAARSGGFDCVPCRAVLERGGSSACNDGMACVKLQSGGANASSCQAGCDSVGSSCVDLAGDSGWCAAVRGYNRNTTGSESIQACVPCSCPANSSCESPGSGTGVFDFFDAVPVCNDGTTGGGGGGSTTACQSDAVCGNSEVCVRDKLGNGQCASHCNQIGTFCSPSLGGPGYCNDLTPFSGSGLVNACVPCPAGCDSTQQCINNLSSSRFDPYDSTCVCVDQLCSQTRGAASRCVGNVCTDACSIGGATTACNSGYSCSALGSCEPQGGGSTGGGTGTGGSCTQQRDCASLAASCGQVFTGCEWMGCGTCGAGLTCGGGGVAHSCGNSNPAARGTQGNPALSCRELLETVPGTPDGTYFIDHDAIAATTAVKTFCDMQTGAGGWTLVGEVGGKFDMYDRWLRTDFNVANLATTTIEGGSYACISAVQLAVFQSSEIRLTNSSRSRWVRWDLPPGRTPDELWNHALTRATIASSPFTDVFVVRQDGATSQCTQNRAGILPFDAHGGSYPYTSNGSNGTTSFADDCMAVGVMSGQSSSTVVHGFTQNGNGFDAPTSEMDWPNASYTSPPTVQVWLR